MEEYLIETDIGNDCDDAGAIAILNNLIDEYDIKVLGIASSISLKESAYCVRIINNYYHHDIETGYCTTPGYYDGGEKEMFTKQIAREYKHDEKVIDYDSCMLNAYKKASDKLNLILIGPLHAFKNFLDKHLDLVNSKTKHIYVMGGKFCKEKVYYEGNEIVNEWNIKECIDGAKALVNKVNVPMTFIPFETGMVETGKNISKDNPVRRCYDISYGFERLSWDPITIYYAITKDSKIFKETNKGFVNVEDDGHTTFKEDISGNATILYPSVSFEEVKIVIDSYLR